MINSIRFFLTVTFIFSLVLAYAQNEEERKLGSFNEVRVSQTITLYLKLGNEEKVRVVADGVDLEDVITEVSGSRLKVYLDRGNYRSVSVKAYVTYKSISSISASSASGVFSDGVIKGRDLSISVSSAADVEVDVDVENIEVSVSSSGDLEIEGKTNVISIEASSAGGVDAYDLQAKVAKVRASSAGSVKVTALEEIDAQASSGASIRYQGNPDKSRTDSSSGGSVRKSN